MAQLSFLMIYFLLSYCLAVRVTDSTLPRHLKPVHTSIRLFCRESFSVPEFAGAHKNYRVVGLGVELERFPEMDVCEVLLTLGLELFMLSIRNFVTSD
jgi:hypothetical protein